MLQVQVKASQERCWEMLSQPERWHEWAPWLLLEVDRPKRGSRIRARFISLPLPGKITVWQPSWRWDWRWGSVTWRHQVDRIDEEHSLVSIQLSGPGAGLVELAYDPIMKIALRRLQRLAESE